MNVQISPENDPRSIDELINTTLTEGDEDVVWDAIAALHCKGNRDALQRACELCDSSCARERRIGADILGQLGVPERTYPAECQAKLQSMLETEEDPRVLQAVLTAVFHQGDAEGIPRVLKFANHSDADVRHGVVLALIGHDAPSAIESLILLTEDTDSDVRDWATFALGTQLDLNTPEIRDALARRLQDVDDDTRGEALVGLARRDDLRVLDALKQELSADCVGMLAIEAAELIASSELHPHLVALRSWWNVYPDLLERAITASSRQ